MDSTSKKETTNNLGEFFALLFKIDERVCVSPFQPGIWSPRLVNQSKV